VQLPGIEHSGNGSRGASADRKRLLRKDLANSQHAPFGTIETACHLLLTAIVVSAHRLQKIRYIHHIHMIN
jgi:hypothetical protein